MKAVSPARRGALARLPRCLRATAAVILLSLPAFEAAAQGSGPLRLIPRKTAPAPAPAETAPERIPPALERAAPGGEDGRLPARPQTVAPAGDAAAPASPNGVVIRSLAVLDEASVGVLGPENGGFGPRMWSGSSHAVLSALMARLPVRQESAVLQSLQRRLLLSAAALPSGEGPDLLALRLANLRDRGWTADLRRLLELVPQAARIGNPDISWIAFETALLAGGRDEACGIARDTAPRDAHRRWQAALALCASLGGDQGRLDLHESLLLDSGPADADLSDLLHHVAQGAPAGRRPRLDGKGRGGPISLALLREARLAPPDAWRTPLEVGRAVWFAPMAHLDDGLRAAAGALLVRTGGLPAAALIADEPGASAANVATAGAGDGGLAGRIRALSSLPAIAHGDLAAVLADAREAGLERAAITLLGGALRQPIDPGATAETADILVRANLLAGDLPRARGWQRVEGSRDRTPALALADVNSAAWYQPAVLERWWRGRAADGGQAGDERAVALLDALDFAIPEAVHRDLLAGGTGDTGRPLAASLARQLASASRDVRLGETLLTVLVAVGEDDLSGLSATGLAAIVGALNRVGLEGEARALALEALLAGSP